jgi:hypothetical protein
MKRHNYNIKTPFFEVIRILIANPYQSKKKLFLSFDLLYKMSSSLLANLRSMLLHITSDNKMIKKRSWIQIQLKRNETQIGVES